MAIAAEKTTGFRSPTPTSFIRLRPLEEPPLLHKLRGKSVCVAMDDAAAYVRKGLPPGLEAASRLSVVGWYDFPLLLPNLSADLVVAMSPSSSNCDIRQVMGAIPAFREKNPGAVFVASYAQHRFNVAAPSVSQVKSSGLFDHVEEGFSTLANLLLIGAEALHQKV